ncbi:hypothetical protein GCM10022281_20450 [Sphingomonas rosea]|uniref:SPOR domain-containing protein n=2 Tax=Sphingomonas rosea TaxID=335605 RepID=A0ABP7UBR5_9SPHN
MITMRKPNTALLAATSIALALTVTGCAMGGKRTSFGGKADNANIGMALRAQAALEGGDVASAVGYAERAVANTPDDAGFRALLGNAYLAAGRFRSAEAAYADALAMVPNQAGVPLKLALTQAAQGKGDAALATIDTYSQMIDPADAGLAMALAGRPGAAVEMLDSAARQPGADARVRQNLALALAMSGDWVRARSIAAQDVPGDQLEARMAEWAKVAQPGQSAAQVALLIGVAPVAGDPGLPVKLALDRGGQSVQTASVEAAPAPVAAPAETVAVAAAPQPVEVAAAAPAPSFAAPAADPMPVEVAAAAPAETQTVAAAPDVADMVDSLRAERVRPSGALPKVAELRRSAAKRFNASNAVLQLGAYATPAGVKMGWSTVSKRHHQLAAYVPASARFAGPRGTVYRLSLKGFASDAEARKVCMQLKASGASCFVRNAAGDAPVMFASR